ncbi:MAG: AMP-binding protein [Candidatus Limnocylindrales bacterium]
MASSPGPSEPRRRGWRGSASGPGDRVGILLPMLPETVVAVLAVSRLGAIFTPIFSGYAAPAIATRLTDCGARLLITADGFLRRGTWVDLKSVADAAVAAAPTVERVLVVRRAGNAWRCRGPVGGMRGGMPGTTRSANRRPGVTRPRPQWGAIQSRRT